MVRPWLVISLLCVAVVCCTAYPADNKNPQTDSKSAFGPAFDEIIVESSLTVKRKNPNRKPKSNPVNADAQEKRVKRQFNIPLYSGFDGSSNQTNAQAQTFDADSPFGNFGASATGANTQSLQFNDNGFQGASALSGTQQYRLPTGEVIDVNFNNGVSYGSNGNLAGAKGSSVTISKPKGSKRTFNIN